MSLEMHLKLHAGAFPAGGQVIDAMVAVETFTSITSPHKAAHQTNRRTLKLQSLRRDNKAAVVQSSGTSSDEPHGPTNQLAYGHNIGGDEDAKANAADGRAQPRPADARSELRSDGPDDGGARCSADEGEQRDGGSFRREGVHKLVARAIQGEDDEGGKDARGRCWCSKRELGVQDAISCGRC
jgi:hypothetical protein